jgi:hypothetical protein
LLISTQGKFEYWVAALKPGVVIFELDVESEEPKPDRGTRQVAFVARKEQFSKFCNSNFPRVHGQV